MCGYYCGWLSWVDIGNLLQPYNCSWMTLSAQYAIEFYCELLPFSETISSVLPYSETIDSRQKSYSNIVILNFGCELFDSNYPGIALRHIFGHFQMSSVYCITTL